MHGQVSLLCDGTRVERGQEVKALAHTLAVQLCPMRGELTNAFANFRRVGVSESRIPDEERQLKLIESPRRMAANPLERGRTMFPGVLDEPAREDESLNAKPACAFYGASHQRPGRLRTPGLAQQPTAFDALFQQLGLNGISIVFHGPIEPVWVSDIDKPDAISEGEAKAGD